MLDDSKQLQGLKELAAEESYFGYGNISDNLMVQACGRRYIGRFGSDQTIWRDPLCDRVHETDESSILRQRTGKALEGKRHLLVVENLHVPVSLDVLLFILHLRWPSVFRNRRWLISATSNDVYEKSRNAKSATALLSLYFTRAYYFPSPSDDLSERDWSLLIKEALRDAARSIYTALQDKGNPEEFWLHVAQHCLYYGILYHPLQGEVGEGAAGLHTSNISCFTFDELVRCWVAEDLIFSTGIPTEIPPADTIGKKHSKYYRSACEAGKVVIQALQEYSLLPVYSACNSTVHTTSKESTSLDFFVTGVSKLAVGVPRLRQDALNTHLKKKSNQLRWVSFMNGDGRHLSWNWGPRETSGHIMMTSLILRGCSNVSEFHLDKLLTPHLRVLDLSYTPINSLPPSFSNLLNLYLLSLRGCTQLQTLSPSTSDKETSSPLAHLENLQSLDMNGVPLLELTQQDGSNKSNLHYLDLSGSMFTTLPSEFFCEMSSLEELIFGNCANLRELPHSMAQLSNLLVLQVEGTKITSFPERMFQKMQSLRTLKLINNQLLMSLPVSLSEAKGLKELHSYNCALLSLEYLWELVPRLEDLHIQTWKSWENIKIHGHPTLRTFSLSGPWIRCLFLRGCSKLKIVNFSEDVTALEDVDLSGTDLEEVPYSLPNQPQLRMLLLLGVPRSMRFPWHQLVRFPKIFFLDHCEDDGNQFFDMFCQKKLCGDGNHQEKKKTTNTAQININDPRMFHSFSADAAHKLVNEGQFLQSFNIQVKRCCVTSNKLRNNEVEQCARIRTHSTYRGLQYLEASRIMPMMKLEPMQRHVEISDVNQYPNGLRHVLSVTNSITIAYDKIVKCLTDLNYSLASCYLMIISCRE